MGVMDLECSTDELIFVLQQMQALIALPGTRLNTPHHLKASFTPRLVQEDANILRRGFNIDRDNGAAAYILHQFSVTIYEYRDES